jgi:glutamate synthase (ferredoxin)
MTYKKSIEAGILKILSKIGISCLSSYQGAQIFEIIGLADEVVEGAFKGSVSRVGGMNYEDLQKEIVQIHEGGYNETLKKLIAAGFLRQKKDGEYHFNNTEAVKFLHKAIYDKDYDHYKLYEDHLSQRPPVSLRDLL